MKNPYKLVIIICWIVLVVCLAFKLFGANIFIASTDNELFIKICTKIDSNIVLQSVVQSIFNLVSCTIYYMAVLKELTITKKSLKWILPLIIYVIIKGVFQDMLVIAFYFIDIFMIIVLPVIITGIKNYKNWIIAIISFVLTFVFQYISMIMKLENYTMFDDNTLVGIILSIDYFIMLILFYLYRNKKIGGEQNGKNGLAMV